MVGMDHDGELALAFGRITKIRKQLEGEGNTEKLEELERELRLQSDAAYASEIRARRTRVRALVVEHERRRREASERG